MARKNKSKSLTHHLFLGSRLGLYLLVGLTVGVLVSVLKSYSPEPSVKAVLGQDDNRGQEVKSENNERREEKKEEIRREFNVSTEGLKVNFRKANGKVERKIESTEELALDEEEEEELEDVIESEFESENETEIATDSSDVTIKKKKIKARTGFPLSIDLATNQLIVTRPDGTTKVVTVLPDQAVANFMRHKKINLINVPGDPTGSGSAEPGGDDPSGSDSAGTDDDDTPISTDSPTLEEDETEVTLREHEGLLVYEIKGKKKLRILGLIPVNVSTTGFVSAETGEVVDVEESLLTRLLNLISI